MDVEYIVLKQVTKGHKSFEALYAAVCEHKVIHRDGLESILNTMKKNKIIEPYMGQWRTYAKPTARMQVDEPEETEGLVYG